MAKFLSKGQPVGESVRVTGPSWPDADFARDYPALAEYMCLDRWEDGSVRETATLLLFVERGRLTCCVTDRDGNRVAFISHTELQSLLEAVEDGLRSNSLDWRERKGGGPKKRN